MVDLKIHLIRTGIKQNQLAKTLGISTRYMSDIILGKRKAPAIRKRLIEELRFPSTVVALDSKSKLSRSAA